MRHYDTSCGPYQNSSSNPYIVLQWCSDTISEITSLVVSQMVLLHHCKTIYRGLVMNSGTPSFLVGTQDIGPHEVS